MTGDIEGNRLVAIAHAGPFIGMGHSSAAVRTFLRACLVVQSGAA
jgi:hypothetical protein